MTDLLWYKDAVFYQIYVRAFRDSNGDGHGDLRGVIEKLDYLQALGVTCLWLMPIYPSPLLDDGYDIAEHYGVLPEYGCITDFRELVDEAHRRGLHVIADLVLNHTSDQHAWFQAARRDRHSPYRDYYVWSDRDDRYQETRIIFLDTQTSNWTWDAVAGQFFWHRFYPSQPDLNYDNPAVQDEMLQVMRHWLEQGIDGFRADAVPYLFEREGTNCENLPETHAYLKRLRRLLDQNYPGRVLLCEANQWPEDVRPYFGDGDEFHMGFHFPVMPRIYMALRRGEREPLEWILERTPPIPPDCQWCTFLRNHDELTLEMVTPEERDWMWQEYAPEPRMRLNLGIRRRLAPLLDNNRRKIELANSLLFTLPGSPIVYYGDEIGMGDNLDLPDRNGVRTPMQWDAGPNAGFSAAPAAALYAPVIAAAPYAAAQVNVIDQMADPTSLWTAIRGMIRARHAHCALGRGSFAWAATTASAAAGQTETAAQTPVDVPAAAAYWRVLDDERLLIVQNLSAAPLAVAIVLPDSCPATFVDILDDAAHLSTPNDRLELVLEPYGYRWLRAQESTGDA